MSARARTACALAVVAWASCLTACGGDAARRARIEEDGRYAEAERAFSERRHADAERLFIAVAEQERTPESQALSAYRRAQIREREGRADEALALYSEAERFEGTERAAFAAWRKARLLAEAGGLSGEALAALRGVVESHPRASAADKAVKYLAVRRDPSHPRSRAEEQALADWMLASAERFQDATVGDNLLFYAAYVQVHRLGDIGGARETLRRLTQRYFVSPLLDDALYLLAALERRQGRYDAAVTALESLLHLRVDQDYLIGGYRSRRLDDAAIALGLIALHLQRDLPAAERAFQRLIDEFPTSVFRDDAYWGLAVARGARQGANAARPVLQALIDERPDSRFAREAKAVLDGRAPLPGPDPARAASALLDPQGKGAL